MEEPTYLKVARQAAELAFGALGTALTLAGLGQTTCQHRHELQWAEIDYFLQVRQVHIETLTNMREDILDMYEMDGRKLDTRMIVATLLLAIGFGFVVEGTFPAPDPGQSSPLQPLYHSQRQLRIFYSITAAFALLSPFWSMLALMECRRRLDFFMDRFNEKFYIMLKKRFQAFLYETRSVERLHHSNLVRFTRDLPQEAHPELARFYDFECDGPWPPDDTGGDDDDPASDDWPQKPGWFPFRCRRRRTPSVDEEERPPQDSANRLDQLRRLHAPGDFDVILALHSHYATWWYDWCRRCAKIASYATWMAIVFNVICCATLLRMYYQFNYQDTPGMWQSYSSLLLLGLAGALTCTGLAHYRGPRLDARQKYVKRLPTGIPHWMKDATDALLDTGHAPGAQMVDV